MHDGELGPVVDYLYEAAVRPELWRPALERLASASNALGAQMLYHRPEGAALHTVSSGLEEISEAFFREGWHINNSREVRPRGRRVGLQEVITESDLFTPEELDRDAFQREFLDRFGLRWFSSFGAIHFDQISPVILTMERPAKLEPFSRAEVEHLSTIVPHIQRACRLSLAVAAAAAAGIMAGLDHVDRAAILLDDMGLVFKTNAAAERLMGHGVTISNRKLRASTRDGDRLLQRLIAIAAANKPPHESPALDAVAIPRRNGRPLVVQGAPLVNSARDLFQQARAILIIRDLDHRMEPDDFLLRELFALTPAEIRLAKAIAGGRKLTEVARLLGVSTETARAHLKSVFEGGGSDYARQQNRWFRRLCRCFLCGGPGRAD
jgi:hypothetical protein